MCKREVNYCKALTPLANGAHHTRFEWQRAHQRAHQRANQRANQRGMRSKERFNLPTRPRIANFLVATLKSLVSVYVCGTILSQTTTTNKAEKQREQP